MRLAIVLVLCLILLFAMTAPALAGTYWHSHNGGGLHKHSTGGTTHYKTYLHKVYNCQTDTYSWVKVVHSFN